MAGESVNQAPASTATVDGPAAVAAKAAKQPVVKQKMVAIMCNQYMRIRGVAYQEGEDTDAKGDPIMMPESRARYQEKAGNVKILGG